MPVSNPVMTMFQPLVGLVIKSNFMIYPMLLGKDLNSFDFCLSEKKRFSKSGQQSVSRTQHFNKKDERKIIPKSVGNVKGGNQLWRVTGRPQNKEPRQEMERKRKRTSQENTEGCSKCIILKNESHFKLASETNTNPVKGIVDEGKRFLSLKPQEQPGHM